MRRIYALLILFVPLMCLSAQIYRSNPLGQMLGSADAIGDAGYFLDSVDGEDILYLDSRPILRTSRKDYGDERIVVETDLLTDVSTIRVYRDGRLVSVSSGDCNESYIYADGRLACYTRTVEGVTELAMFFIRGGGNGALAAVRQGDELRLVSDSYIYEDGNLFELISGGLVVQGEHEALHDGTIKVVSDGTEYIYDADGRLLSSDDSRTVTQYVYDGLKLAGVITRDALIRREELYRDGKAIQLNVYSGEELESVTVYRAEGNMQTVYKGGRAVATIYYKSDNRTIERIEYR